MLDYEALLSLLALTDVHHGSDKFYDVTRLTHDGVADTVNVLNRSVRKHNPKLRFKIGFFDVSLSIRLFDPGPIFRMHSREKEISDRSVIPRSDTPDPSHLRRDSHRSGCKVMVPATRAAQLLGIKERCFTTPQFLFRVLSIINIDEQVIPADNLTFIIA